MDGDDSELPDSSDAPEVCEIGEGDAPSFSLEHESLVLSSEGELFPECGGQGALMFYFDVDVVGVDPGGTDMLPFVVTIDVDGASSYEGGHFIERDMEVDVGCGGPSNLVVLLPSSVRDAGDLEDLPFSMEVVMMPESSQEVRFASEGLVGAPVNCDFGDDDDDDDDADDADGAGSTG